jgi:hypothetical protein
MCVIIGAQRQSSKRQAPFLCNAVRADFLEEWNLKNGAVLISHSDCKGV